MELHQFEDYREFLNHRLEETCRRNPRASLRSFAKNLHISPSQLSKVLNRKNGLSIETATVVCERLGLRDEETSYFCDLVQSVHGRSPASRRIALNRIHAHRKIPGHLELQLDLFKVISDWFHYAILELTFLDDFQSDVRWIASKLGISEVQTKQAIQRLKKLELLKEEDGKLKKTVRDIDTPKDLQSEGIRKANQQLIEMAKEAVTEQTHDQRILSTMTMAIDPEKLPEARKMIIDFKFKLCRFLESGKRKSIYCFANQLFELSRAQKNKRRTK